MAITIPETEPLEFYRERRLNLNEPTYLIIPHLLGLFITSFKKLESELHLTALRMGAQQVI